MLTMEADLRNIYAAINEALPFYSRTIEETLNKTVSAIGRSAVAHTYAPPKGVIASALNKPARINPRAKVANILVNVKRAAAGKVGLNGAKMTTATETLIRVEESHRQYVRSYLLKGLRGIAPYVKSKGGQPKLPKGLRIRDNIQGGATPAKSNSNWQAVAGIWGNVKIKNNNDKVQQYINEGIHLGFVDETQSKLDYALKKKIEEGYVLFNRR